MVAYHDSEWGVPLHEDHKWFEFIILDAFQAGLSWKTILHKRENFRQAFDNFDYHKVAVYGEAKIETLLKDAGIIRNRLKVQAAVTNAQAFIAIQKEFGSFDAYIWKFADGKPVVNRWALLSEIPASSSLSDAISKDMKKRGFKFVGTTIVYAFLQAGGIVNDHLVSCFRHAELDDDNY